MTKTGTLMERFGKDLEKQYGIIPTSIYEAPRGFAAETYFIETAEEPFFLKIMSNPRRQPPFKHGLKVVNDLRKIGDIDYIPELIETNTGDLYFKKEGSVLALFNKINAEQTYQYKKENVFRKLANIYKTSEKLDKENFIKEDFNDAFISVYEKQLHDLLNQELWGEALEVKHLLEPHTAFLFGCPKKARATINECQKQPTDFYLTHSDFPGNVMVSENEEHYLIDFDEAYFAPIERDGFLTIALENEDSELWLSVIKENFPDYTVNHSFVRFYLYERFMVDLAEFMKQLLEHSDPVYRKKIVKSTKDYLLNWLHPLLVNYS